MDIQATKTVYTITFTQGEMAEILMAAHHYIMREMPEAGELIAKAQKDEHTDVIIELAECWYE
jgi:hypothetical protein